jgi:intracellular septation protein A
MYDDDDESTRRDGDLSDLLNEMRVLLPGAQTLTAFLIILPFNGGFAEIRGSEKTIYAITFVCSLLALIFFTAPAAQHRLQRPLRNRAGFKEDATKLIVIGLVPLSVALVLASQLVLSQVMTDLWVSWVVAGSLFVAIAALWWIMPTLRHHKYQDDSRD